MDFGLEGKVAMVAAASKGIGLAIARELSREGCILSICARSEENLEVAVDQIPGEARSYVVDVGNAEEMADAICRVLGQSPDGWRAMSAASYDIAKEFDWDLSAEKLERNLYRWLDASRESAA